MTIRPPDLYWRHNVANAEHDRAPTTEGPFPTREAAEAVVARKLATGSADTVYAVARRDAAWLVFEYSYANVLTRPIGIGKDWRADIEELRIDDAVERFDEFYVFDHEGHMGVPSANGWLALDDYSITPATLDDKNRVRPVHNEWQARQLEAPEPSPLSGVPTGKSGTE